VRELKKRQQKEREKEVKRREKQLDKEKAERAAQARLKMEQEAYQLQVRLACLMMLLPAGICPCMPFTHSPVLATQYLTAIFGDQAVGHRISLDGPISWPQLSAIPGLFATHQVYNIMPIFSDAVPHITLLVRCYRLLHWHRK